MAIFEHRVIAGVDGDPYLKRWSLFLPFGASIKLHHILRSDEDRDLHDHPWSFVSIILRGGYYEHTYRPCIGGQQHQFRTTADIWHPHCVVCGLYKKFTIRTWHGVGSILLRPHPWPHRLEIPEGRTAWTLIFTGPKRRQWGFITVCGWIPWFRYTQAKEEGC